MNVTKSSKENSVCPRWNVRREKTSPRPEKNFGKRKEKEMDFLIGVSTASKYAIIAILLVYGVLAVICVEFMARKFVWKQGKFREVFGFSPVKNWGEAYVNQDYVDGTLENLARRIRSAIEAEETFRKGGFLSVSGGDHRSEKLRELQRLIKDAKRDFWTAYGLANNFRYHVHRIKKVKEMPGGKREQEYVQSWRPYAACGERCALNIGSLCRHFVPE